MGKYNWDDSISVTCRKSDKKKLKQVYEQWKELTGIRVSFNTYINCVLFPNLFAEVRATHLKRKNEKYVRIQKKYEQLIQLRKERNIKYGKRRTGNQ
jgi:hypothetical protein